MKNAMIRKMMLVAIGGLFVWWSSKSPAQEAPGNNVSLQMPDTVNQVLELDQAKIGDSTIIAYIKSSGTSFNLNAAQIVFLREQGLSDAVITAMLTQPRTDVSVAPVQPPAPAPQLMAETSAASATDPAVIAQPQVPYVQAASAPAQYSYSYYQYPYSYPYSYSYAYYPNYVYCGWPRVWWPFGWTWYGGGWHRGWGGHGGGTEWHGGWGGHGSWGGGWHGGGGFHGGWHGGGGHR